MRFSRAARTLRFAWTRDRAHIVTNRDVSQVGGTLDRSRLSSSMRTTSELALRDGRVFFIERDIAQPFSSAIFRVRTGRSVGRHAFVVDAFDIRQRDGDFAGETGVGAFVVDLGGLLGLLWISSASQALSSGERLSTSGSQSVRTSITSDSSRGSNLL